jgi:hypothetical protein
VLPVLSTDSEFGVRNLDLLVDDAAVTGRTQAK